ncbi:fibroblast growth factor receptor 4-like [Amphiura filiformis]|uniref:fibroblast growth factor receptor 4-like n=1 Tax=Amphiura filiformis TaxID=82378 RepID=UPI003B21FCFD
MHPESPWTISMNQLTFGKEITKHTGYYQIRKGKFTSLRGQTTSVVVKTCGVAADVDTRRKLQNESEILKLIGECYNIVQLMGTCENQGDFHEVLECCPAGSLNNYLRENSSKLDNANELLLGMAISIAHGMEYIADRKFVHRDLGTENILISSSNVIKICGFGYATLAGKNPLKIPELTNWRSKSFESLCDGIYTIQGDVWSFGIVLWELLSPGTSTLKQFLDKIIVFKAGF